ncbi:MAG: hypothetical protein IJ058_00445 [Lachnospiraceae bacterium]|nr:hypothetical protein [Lachnospiraceae bacterium]
MTSKISSWPEIKTRDIQTELTKRRMWVTALVILVCVCYFVLGTILSLAHARDVFSWDYEPGAQLSLHEFLISNTAAWLGISSWTLMLTIPAAMIAAFASFTFLYKSQAVDFYFSQAITRTRQFVNIYLNSFVTYAVLSLIFTVIGVLISGVMGGFAVYLIPEVIINWLRNQLLYFTLYNTVILAILLCKNMLTSVIVTGIFLFGDMLIYALYNQMKEMFFTTYYDVDWVFDPVKTRTPRFLSPILNHVYGKSVYDAIQMQLTDSVRQWEKYRLEGLAAMLKFDVVTLLFGVIVGASALYVYNHRRAEDIGPGLISPVIKNILKFIVAIPTAILGAMMVDSILNTNARRFEVMPVVILIFVAAVACIVTEMICSGRLKQGFRSLWHIGVVSGCALVILAVFKLDLVGYDSFLPDPEKVQDCALFSMYIDRDIRDENGNYVNSTRYYAENMHLTDITDVIRIADIGQKTARHNGTLEQNDHAINGYNTLVVYHMKNGKNVMRSLLIPYDTDKALMDPVIGSPEYTDAIYGLDSVTERQKKDRISGYLRFVTGYTQKEIKVDPETFEEFAEHYRNDLTKFDFTLASGSYPIGTVFYRESAGEYRQYSYEVYDVYDETMDFLKERGIYTDPGLPVDRIISADIDMTEYDENGRSMYDYSAEITDPDQLKELAELVAYPHFNEWNVDFYGNSITFTLDFVDESESDYPTTGGIYSGYFVPNGRMPEDVLEILRENVEYDYTQGM